MNDRLKEINESDDDSEEDEDFSDEPVVSAQELQEIPMPAITPGSEYLVAFLHSAGSASATGMGLVSLSWQEINAWVECCDMKDIITPRDLKTIYTLSRAYAGECARASQKGAVAPYVPEVVDMEEIREIVSDKADDIFENMFAEQGWD